jgi:hypothetical protein
MAKRAQIGDIYAVDLGDNTKKYFQHIADDQSQLGSAVIRVFKTAYPVIAEPELNEVTSGKVEFFAHVFIKFGITLKVWERVGNVPFSGQIDVVFRDSGDYGSPEVAVSDDWWVWRINEEARRVGKLAGADRLAEIGIVVAPPHLVERMQTGVYSFKYPMFR